ncbi:uncharacterized protein F5891DRAFT_1130825 [Suillus fuscotomentosus]|uniref:TMEM205-like domain-containing protein n=1 Tax=Suillus fuscotomentosus TaxID=1912939 RepID=A0AAD4HFP8_9AGAM|nr:uncharacterized protein F5891DRAFT_1130825 [Suillus fuscotomentosus]KAG1894883.1 hypothetical protein F5891DRAFT_1130825 [Suillus fuscotomentosus]
MAHVEVVSPASFLGTVSPKGVYILGYGWLYGMSVWVSFFGGIIALRTLPRHQFGALQHKTFPIYFSSSIGLSSALLGLWAYVHPELLANITSPLRADVAQAYVLGTVIALQSCNQFVVGPMTSRTMFQRHKLEKEEGKNYDEPGVSAQMKALNTKFRMLHGMSSLANLGAVIALTFHGLWIGSYGL